MKNLRNLILGIGVLCIAALSAKAQDGSPASDLVKQGIALYNQGKYADAMAKYNEVLKTDPENAYANYEMAYSLYMAKKPQDAVPYLQKAVKATTGNIGAAAYSLWASIYDEARDTKNAVAMYREAIKIDPNYPQIYYNFGIAYFRNQQYLEAEECAIEAIRRNPANASSQRLYALVTFHQNKRANALLGFCSFLLLEPTGARAAEAYGNIQHIIQGGVLTDAAGKTTITIPSDEDKESNTFNLGIQLVTASAKTKNLAGADLLEYELKSIFSFAGELSAKKTDRSFFDKFFVEYFYKLSQTDNMPAFTRTMMLSDTKGDSAKWLKDNATQATALNDWVANTNRGL